MWADDAGASYASRAPRWAELASCRTGAGIYSRTCAVAVHASGRLARCSLSGRVEDVLRCGSERSRTNTQHALPDAVGIAEKGCRASAAAAAWLQACELAGRDLLLFLAESAKLESEMTRADFLSTVRRAAPRPLVLGVPREAPDSNASRPCLSLLCCVGGVGAVVLCADDAAVYERRWRVRHSDSPAEAV